MDILVSRGDVACSGFRSLLLCCTFFSFYGCPPCFLSNDKQKRHKTKSREKQRHQNELKQALLCSDPGLEFCPHVPIWSLLLQSLNTQIPATFPQPHDWDSLGVAERKFASLHGSVRVCLCVSLWECVCCAPSCMTWLDVTDSSACSILEEVIPADEQQWRLWIR